MINRIRNTPRWQGSLDNEFQSACNLVMNATDRSMAFNDYDLVIEAFGVNGHYAIDGSIRSDFEHRNNPFSEGFDGEHFVDALFLAEEFGIEMKRLASFLCACGPRTGAQTLCIVEDAVIILAKFPEMEGVLP